jgi:hypothetical protein
MGAGRTRLEPFIAVLRSPGFYRDDIIAAMAQSPALAAKPEVCAPLTLRRHDALVFPF